MAYFDETYLKECKVFAVSNTRGKIISYVTIQPNYSSSGQASIDMIRADADALSNTTDFMFHRLMTELYSAGWRSLDLGLAPLSGLHGSPSVSERGLNLLYTRSNRWFSFTGLRRFKNKFQPHWEARYLLYTGTSARLPVVARAVNKLLKYDKESDIL